MRGQSDEPKKVSVFLHHIGRGLGRVLSVDNLVVRQNQKTLTRSTARRGSADYEKYMTASVTITIKNEAYGNTNFEFELSDQFVMRCTTSHHIYTFL